MRARAGHALHLARRFAGSLSRREPSEADARWADERLLPGEARLFRRMSPQDRRHAIAVARRVDAALPGAARAALAAALLHDVGKVEAGLGTFARVGATLASGLLGRERCSRGGGRLARYLRHPEIGGELCRSAGSEPLTAAWAAEHHIPPARWTVPADVGAALKAADDD